MRQRKLGRTNLPVSELGFGAWGIGGRQWIGADDAESLRALQTAIDHGVTLVDTALAYGDGHSERLVGRAVRGRTGVAIATKVPPRNGIWPATADMRLEDCYPPDHVARSCEESLRNLGVERIDLLQLHTWDDSFLAWDSWAEPLLDLKRSGKVRFVGVSVTEHEAATALGVVATGLIDAAQILYNIFDPRAAERLLPACLRHGVGVLARVPLDEGGLTGTVGPETRFPAGDFRNHYFRGDRKREVWEHARDLQGLLGDEAKTLPELAIRFCLSHEAVSTVIPGMRTVDRVRTNLDLVGHGSLSSGLLTRMQGHAWPRNFYQ
jgi:aryl-alcohol dehydrogenase-like predicted oxidoreductase